MSLKKIGNFLFGSQIHMTREDAMKVFRRDHFKCQYCGLDGMHHFEHWLVLTVDHIHPHAHGGSRRMDNLVTACRPCNLMKGKHIFKSFEEAKNYVQGKRAEWQKMFKEQVKT